jgi:hypothetical protein
LGGAYPIHGRQGLASFGLQLNPPLENHPQLRCHFVAGRPSAQTPRQERISPYTFVPPSIFSYRVVPSLAVAFYGLAQRLGGNSVERGQIGVEQNLASTDFEDEGFNRASPRDL